MLHRLRTQYIQHLQYLKNIQYVQYKLYIQYSQCIQDSTGQDRTVQHSTVRYSTVQYSTVQYSTIQYSTVQYNTVHYSTQNIASLHYSTEQYCTFLCILSSKYAELPETQGNLAQHRWFLGINSDCFHTYSFSLGPPFAMLTLPVYHLHHFGIREVIEDHSC